MLGAITLGTIGWLLLVLIFIITLIKKKRQVGKTWSGPLSAQVQIAGKKLCCKHCGNNQFQKREGILVTSLVCLFNFSFWNQSAVCYTCVNCGFIDWFVKATEEKVKIERNLDLADTE